jgi:hypothetical protein
MELSCSEQVRCPHLAVNSLHLFLFPLTLPVRSSLAVDGANIEIAEKVGEDNVFFFGFLTPDVEAQRRENRFHPVPVEKKSPALAVVFKAIEQGVFGDYAVFAPLVESVTQHGDVSRVAARWVEPREAGERGMR